MYVNIWIAFDQQTPLPVSSNLSNFLMQISSLKNIQSTRDGRLVYYQSMNVILHLNICYVLVCGG